LQSFDFPVLFKILKNQGKDFWYEFVDRGHGDLADAGFSMKPHPEPDFVRRELKGGFSCCWNGTGCRANANSARLQDRFLGHGFKLFQCGEHLGSRASEFHNKNKAGNPAAVLFPRRGRCADIIPNPNRAHLDPRVFSKLTPEIKVHGISRIVTVEIKNPVPPVDSFRGFKNNIGRRCGKDIPASGTVCEVPSDKAMVDGFVTAAATDQQGYLVVRYLCFDNRAGADIFAFAIIGLNQAFKEFVGHVEGIIDEFVHLERKKSHDRTELCLAEPGRFDKSKIRDPGRSGHFCAGTSKNFQERLRLPHPIGNIPLVSYRVFARKYRPATFEEVVGQEHITRTLQNAIREDRLAQAYLLVGPRGIGKTSTARILAKALNCEKGPTPHPCGKCSACLEIAEGNNMDVVEIDGASNNGVENIRDLRDNAQYSPVRGPYKIYLIDEVHMLTIGAFNALLKTLEEPPPHVKFIFATTESHKVPATITSRCQRFDLRRIPDQLIAKHLLFIAGQEGVDLDTKAADAIARGADGGLRDAESMFDQVISFCGKTIAAKDVLDVFGFTAREVVQSLAAHILNADISSSLQIVEEQDQAGKDLTRLVEALVSHLRDLLIVQATGQGDAAIKEAASLVDREKMIELLEHFAATEGQLRWSTDKRMHVDVSVIKGIHLIEQASLTEVIDTIASLRDGSPAPILKAPAPKPAARATAPAPAQKAQAAPSKPTPQEPPPKAPDHPSPNVPEDKPRNQEIAAQDQSNESPKATATAPPNTGPAGAQAWRMVSERLSEQSPIFYGWLTTGVFQVESGGRIIVEFPETQRSCMEDEIWKENLALIDKELAKECGQAVRFHAEFVPDDSMSENPHAGTSNDPDPYDSSEESSRLEPAPAFESSKPTRAEEAKADPMEEFQNDPLIQKALDIFEGELISSQRS
jgi:DNA polymerase-3 subunit gamma/tau